MLLIIILLVLMLSMPSLAEGPLVIEPDGKPGMKVHFWLESSLKRVYPKSEPGSAKPLEILAPRNGQVGDPFEVYPGADGKPIDSLRWEVFAESLQDYAVLQTAGIKPTDPMLADIKSYADFPKNEQWIKQAVGKILR